MSTTLSQSTRHDVKPMYLPKDYVSQPTNLTVDANRDGECYWSDWRISQSGKYQAHVYRWAANLIRRAGYERVLDVGCGVGTKLENFIAPTGAEIVGIDQAAAVAHCRRLGRSGTFAEVDLEKPTFETTGKFGLIIFADVIEHLVDPDPALNMIRHALERDGLALISTPDRDRRRGRKCRRSEKPEHVREWARREFIKFIKSRGFCVHASKVLPQDDAPIWRGVVKEALWQAGVARTSPMACHAVLCGHG